MPWIFLVPLAFMSIIVSDMPILQSQEFGNSIIEGSESKKYLEVKDGFEKNQAVGDMKFEGRSLLPCTFDHCKNIESLAVSKSLRPGDTVPN